MEEVIEGFNAYQNSLFEKLMAPLNEYTLCMLKIQQLKSNKASSKAISDVYDKMSKAKDETYKILSQEQAKA